MNPENRYIHIEFPVPDREKVAERISREAKNPELEAVLDAVDFEDLRNIYSDVARRYGIRSMNFITREFISTDVWNPENMAEYDVEDNIIAIDRNKIDKRFPPILSRNLLTLAYLTHEEGHATQFTEKLSIFDENSAQYGDVVRRERAGYYQDTTVMVEDRITSRRDLFRRFNEGVNEKLSREVLLVYLERHPDFATPEEIELLKRYYAEDPHELVMGKWPLMYHRNVALVDHLIARISIETEVPQDVVWGSIVNGAYNGLDLMELQGEFEEMFSPGILERINKAWLKDQYEDLYDEILPSQHSQQVSSEEYIDGTVETGMQNESLAPRSQDQLWQKALSFLGIKRKS